MSLKAISIAPGNSYQAVFDEVKDASGALVDDAPGELTIRDLSGNDVGGVTWPIALTLSGSGRYVGVVPATLEVVAGSVYVGTVVATRGSDTATQKVLFVAEDRSA